MRTFISLLFFLSLIHAPLYAQDNEVCNSCHGQESSDIPFVNLKQFEGSIHGKNPCISCHVDAEVIPHPSKPQASSCASCHEDVLKVYENSVHGKARARGIKEAPFCNDCHGEHTILSVNDPASTVWKGRITKTCASCHDSEKIVTKFGLPKDRLETFQNSYHGLASRGGDFKVANCASCHGWHGILPSSDPLSSVHPKNLYQTCGKCHPGAPSKLFTGKVHGKKKTEVFFLVRWVKVFYLVLIPFVVGFMFVHNFSDYLRKTLSYISSSGVKHEVNQGTNLAERLNLNERFQHGFLLFVFILLAYSGFALKFPEMWWAYPFQWIGGEVLRKAIHRWAALLFCFVSAYHLIYMVFTRRGRFLLKISLIPKIKDLKDLSELMLYNFGVRKQIKHLAYPSYIEKVEYWSLIWGSLIMILTGALLVFNDFTLRYLPLWIIELATLIHFYEAVLACLSILIWHFYWTIFDPDIYPMNLSWLIGRVRSKKWTI
ncbi:MAG: hypothetical protein A3I11_07180 [Elusimicrobia bacterium RIFCSPLOWO2_02_FULL_39_32]|nr:MAG: hypothetical protein A3B80_05445 [Elusimicrobia bacterium RIFCSPHIGHO2_02_FULL_39_36]OGR91969.1 MAG: hypothetical protein A3I11_07180 [Elusimicrobia bacterium RIFCSPLOWO2_02_FULL_39_32]OGR98739.1 MAG: hypothetical protein A3G85_05250 [Elusimicrobia bacterium RIFCSPLOWO2_12_FULL_39_28]